MKKKHLKDILRSVTDPLGRSKWFTPSFLLMPLLVSTACQQDLPPTVIAVSKTSPNYINWLKRADSTVRIVNLYSLPVDSAIEVLETTAGLLLTGGEDVYPEIYGEAGDTVRCGSLDRYRDTLEINLILKALELEMPIFGICRGEQILNVVFGGNLFLDLPEDFDTAVLHRCDDYLSCFHMVYVEPGSTLHRFCDCDSALVTTNHHQAVQALAPDLRAGGYGPDGLIESIELKDPGRQPFFLAVQWHPERMEETNPLSGPLAEAFIAACRRYSPKW